MVDLGTVRKMRYSAAWGCSADGNVVVGKSWSTWGRDEVAFRWTSTTGMVKLGYLPGETYSEADAVSPDGSIVVGGSGSSDGVQAFIWDAAHGMRRLADVLAAKIRTSGDAADANGIAVNAGVVSIAGVGVNPDAIPRPGEPSSCSELLSGKEVTMSGWCSTSRRAPSAHEGKRHG
jgi:probable HAF family extracellular repeat protein